MSSAGVNLVRVEFYSVSKLYSLNFKNPWQKLVYLNNALVP